MPTRHELIQLAEGGFSAVATGLGQPELVPMIVTAGEGINEGLDLYDEGRKMADDFGNDEEFINNTQIPTQMSNKATRYGPGSSPGQAPRTGKVPTVTTYAHKLTKGGKFSTPKTTVSLKKGGTPSAGKLTNSLTQDQKYFDSNLLVTTGENRLTSLNVKLGKQVYPDCITPFLQALNGHGKVRMQFGGRCISNIGKRHTSIQMFRHNLSSNTTGSADYPSLNLPNILDPGNPEAFYPSGSSSVGASNPIGTTSMRDIKSQQDYWAPYNLSDLEDLSWNLNKLKLGQPVWAQGAAVPTQKFQVPIFRTNAHQRRSAIFQNNDLVGVLPGSSGSAASPYRYNAVMNKGSVHYDFMNKGTGGAKVEIIVYRVKKSNPLAQQTSSFFGTNNAITKSINIPIGVGYLDTQLAAAGTDALNGRKPSATDVYEDAAFPLLPNLKKTKQIDLPFVEVVRQTFAMTSGSRRELIIDLPGHVYDPNNISGKGATTSSNVPSIIHPFTYVVYMSVSGVVCTDQVTPDSTAADKNYLVGDMISAANVQFYATYTEHMGACQYKTIPNPNLYSQGAIIAPASSVPEGFSADVPVTMLDQASAVRLPAQSSAGAGGTNLRNDFDAVAQP